MLASKSCVIVVEFAERAVYEIQADAENDAVDVDPVAVEATVKLVFETIDVITAFVRLYPADDAPVIVTV